jgi:cytochrome P450
LEPAGCAHWTGELWGREIILTAPEPRRLPQASVRDTAAVVAEVFLPLLAQGAIIRRPKITALAERFDTDRRGVALLGRLAARYGSGPLMLRIPGRRVAVVLRQEHVQRLLEATPGPFTAASRDKRAALAHFEPDAVLATPGPQRADRRRLNEAVLDPNRTMHRPDQPAVAAVREEIDLLMTDRSDPRLGWPEFSDAWWRVTRRIVLGDSARDDRETIDLLTTLRRDANWAFLRPRRNSVRAAFVSRLEDYLAKADPDSLVGRLAATPYDDRAAAVGQVPHWLFAFDAAGIAVWRAAALLAAHPDEQAAVRTEHADAGAAVELPRASATLLESLRLWPTTVAILRESTRPTQWDERTAPKGTEFVTVTAYFQRDPVAVPYADRFEPTSWLDGRADGNWSLIPFSGGPADCPGRNLVLETASVALSELVGRFQLAPAGRRRLVPGRPLPGTLDHAGLKLLLAPVESTGPARSAAQHCR